MNEKNEQVGIVPIDQALQKAQQQGLDLIEVAPNAKPPVCRIIDYGKYKYEKAKKEKEAKKKQHVVHLKELRFHGKTDAHDYNFKVDHAKKFLIKGDRVRATVIFRGREIVHKDLGSELLEQLKNDLADFATVEIDRKMEGRNMVSIFVPDKKKIQQIQQKTDKE